MDDNPLTAVLEVVERGTMRRLGHQHDVGGVEAPERHSLVEMSELVDQALDGDWSINDILRWRSETWAGR